MLGRQTAWVDDSENRTSNAPGGGDEDGACGTSTIVFDQLLQGLVSAHQGASMSPRLLSHQADGLAELPSLPGSLNFRGDDSLSMPRILSRFCSLDSPRMADTISVLSFDSRFESPDEGPAQDDGDDSGFDTVSDVESSVSDLLREHDLATLAEYWSSPDTHGFSEPPCPPQHEEVLPVTGSLPRLEAFRAHTPGPLTVRSESTFHTASPRNHESSRGASSVYSASSIGSSGVVHVVGEMSPFQTNWLDLMQGDEDKQGARLSEKEIEALPKTEFEGCDAAACAICLEGYAKREVINQLHCGHCYHVACLSVWMQRANSCPLCRDAAHCERQQHASA
eukprot:TRINITY_DN28620_c0_g1_i1.p1 TRINITY_DN28620_c0_g1~~TRINITY_DN28620_c0_g1_i1.p1  ORF type:complete len:337 (-),score=50.85 TRINITY_DN28620_c0_g1_i1:171-1181(-)